MFQAEYPYLFQETDERILYLAFVWEAILYHWISIRALQEGQMSLLGQMLEFRKHPSHKSANLLY